MDRSHQIPDPKYCLCTRKITVFNVKMVTSTEMIMDFPFEI